MLASTYYQQILFGFRYSSVILRSLFCLLKVMKKFTLFATLVLVANSSFAQWNLSSGMGTDYSGSREIEQSQRSFRDAQDMRQRQQRYFKGFPCKDDCLGHIAGYTWAVRKGIDHTSQCGGNSQSFFEGCFAYADGR